MILGAIASVLPAEASLLYEQSGAEGNNERADAQYPGMWQIADSFQLPEAATVDTIRWEGQFAGLEGPIADPVAFTLQIFASAPDGKPQDVPLYTVTQDVTRNLEADLPFYMSGLNWNLDANTKYWISLYDVDPRTDDDDGGSYFDYFGWNLHTASPPQGGETGVYIKPIGGTGWSDTSYWESIDMTFRLESADSPELPVTILPAHILRFQSEIGILYQLETTEDLETWSPTEHSLVGDGDVLEFCIERTKPQEFYRVSQQ